MYSSGWKKSGNSNVNCTTRNNSIVPSFQQKKINLDVSGVKLKPTGICLGCELRDQTLHFSLYLSLPFVVFIASSRGARECSIFKTTFFSSLVYMDTQIGLHKRSHNRSAARVKLPVRCYFFQLSSFFFQTMTPVTDLRPAIWVLSVASAKSRNKYPIVYFPDDNKVVSDAIWLPFGRYTDHQKENTLHGWILPGRQKLLPQNGAHHRRGHRRRNPGVSSVHNQR